MKRKVLLVLAFLSLIQFIIWTPPPARAWNLLVECCSWGVSWCCDRDNDGYWGHGRGDGESNGLTVRDTDPESSDPDDLGIYPRPYDSDGDPDNYDYDRPDRGATFQVGK